ncbi:lipase maturation factor family protein [Streptomyces stelliscabiei]|uniref:lipase maturation factor family protein n=1 Tax=Streptomyces stelliscabiei TaxID=146820 RepID=UPI002FF20FD4
MDWFTAPDLWLSRLLFQRSLAAVYLVAFLGAALQFRALIGERGMLPVPRFVERVPFRRAPSVFHRHYSDRFFAVWAWAGCVVSAALVAGLDALLPLWAAMLLWSVPWAMYLSIVNVGQTWYAFGWESLLLETGFLAVLLGNDEVAYGAFGSVSRVRYEVVVEGTADDVPREDSEWREYEFRGKPGDPRRWPRQFAPYHLRLDWLMWFAALSPAYAGSWFGALMERLLENDRDTLRLLRRSPFPADAPPRFVRARLFRYRYTTWRELRETGACWERTYVREFMPPTRLAGPPARTP